MALLDRIVKANFVPPGYGPKFKVYDYWYNLLVDKINTTQSTGRIDTDLLGGVPVCALPSVTHVLFDDFDLSAAAAAPLATWTVTETAGGCTQLLIDATGGVLQLTNEATTDNSGQQVQLIQESFRLTVGKKLWFEVRFRCPCADVTDLDLFLGLAETENITAVEDDMPANGVGFYKDDDAVGTIFLASSDNGTNIVSPAAVKTLVANTWTRLGFYFNGGATGAATITPYVDGVAGTPLTSITYATMVELAPIFMVRNGDATETQILDLDYFLAVQER
jgi:hypothetical protein